MVYLPPRQYQARYAIHCFSNDTGGWNRAVLMIPRQRKIPCHYSELEMLCLTTLPCPIPSCFSISLPVLHPRDKAPPLLDLPWGVPAAGHQAQCTPSCGTPSLAPVHLDGGKGVTFQLVDVFLIPNILPLPGPKCLLLCWSEAFVHARLFCPKRNPEVWKCFKLCRPLHDQGRPRLSWTRGMRIS